MISLPTQNEIQDCYELLKRDGITSSIIRVHDDLYVKNDGSLPMNSYKMRGVHNYFRKMKNQDRFEVFSAGNLALAVASECQNRGIHLKAIVPSGISDIKRSRLISLGASVEEIEFDQIWELVKQDPKSFGSQMIHPFHPDLLCGYATVVLETLEQMSNLTTMTIPYGLGGLAVSVVHAASIFAPELKICPVEICGFAPLSRALGARTPSLGPKLKSFIEALGTPEVLPSIFESVRQRLEGCIEVNEEEVKVQIRRLHTELGIKVEGAAAVALAGAEKIKSEARQGGSIVAHLTGANISSDIFNEIVHA